jgi:anti-sigma regulatory factor (Ser/Thr protein kinase)
VEAVLSSHSRQSSFHIGAPSEIAAARRAATSLAINLGFNETVTGQVALVVTEAGTNIAKYAVSGEILLRNAVRFDGALGIEILAIDAGPGIANLGLYMNDGVSSGGTYGIGLGTMRRVAGEFDIYSAPGKGTAICMSFWGAPDPDRITSCDIGVVCLPVAGESICGDAWVIKRDRDGVTILVADGLGHGPIAAIASEAATMVVAKKGATLVSASHVLQDAHHDLNGTRGAAVAVAHLDSDSGNMTFAGVGNIAARIVEQGVSRHLISHNGIVGSNVRKVQEFASTWSSDALLLLHSDGLTTRWSLDQYPGLERLCPPLIAAVLYRDFVRRNDDATVLVYREHRNHSL